MRDVHLGMLKGVVRELKYNKNLLLYIYHEEKNENENEENLENLEVLVQDLSSIVQRIKNIHPILENPEWYSDN